MRIKWYFLLKAKNGAHFGVAKDVETPSLGSRVENVERKWALKSKIVLVKNELKSYLAVNNKNWQN